jgi:hypothetical protein
MDKLLLFPGASEKGIFTFVVDTEQSHLIKTAAEYHPTIAAYINSAKKIPGKTQILLTALGAGEYWGPNVNGDYFPESSLAHEGEKYGYRTFKTNAKVYKHHINKDPTAAYGDVGLSVYNPRYHRVELIVLLDNERAPDIVERVEAGEYPEWSMGCRVPYDECNNCGNKAPTRKQYCECLRYYMGKIHPVTGRLCYAINWTPNFFDISQVLIGADKIAKTLKKVASVHYRPSSAYIAEKMAETKVSAIEKQIPASDPPGAQDLVRGIMEVKSREKELPRPLLNQLGKRPLPHVLSTLSMLGIIPKPQEFQRIVLIAIGKPSLADQLDERNMCFDPMMVTEPSEEHMDMAGISHHNFDPDIFSMLSEHMADRSYVAPHLGRRILEMLEKRASYQPLPTFIKVGNDDDRKPFGIIPVLALAAGLYAAVARKAAPEAATYIDKLVSKHRGLALALGIGAAATAGAMFGKHQKGQYVQGGHEENPDVSNIAARIEEMRMKPILKVGASNMLSAGKQIFGGVPAAYIASGIAQKHRESNPMEQEGRVHRFIRQYPDVISAGVVLNALAHAQGKGIYHKISKYAAQSSSNKIKSKIADIMKIASATDMLSSALIWPVAFGRAGLPGRIAGGVFDQAVVEAGRKLLSNTQKPNKLETDQRKE